MTMELAVDRADSWKGKGEGRWGGRGEGREREETKGQE